ncbi:DUF4416 family protein [Candidatus Uabimicrobium amorphum]|uniref:GTP-binding protein n=1 Tax=Uabimicrobium amorphum TaxID=2596890 RepID=A0A5S9IJC0_UABAM|nr:DUF4416 family protein [Candidatus Uabimicrobium amorphum]BBM82607.1 hypothetical protein UABAM_00950 [Candidatus Uabimicrobium amorphum]
MAHISPPKPVKLFVGCIFADKKVFEDAYLILSKKYGTIDIFSDIWDFSHTNYYEKEMGKNLYKTFISFKDLILPETIKDIKIFSNELEESFQETLDMKRPINLDPGYLDAAKVILATTKDYTHRIYLASGIYAEVELFYQQKTYHAWPWTYPDYQFPHYIDFFLGVRKVYREQLRHIN